MAEKRHYHFGMKKKQYFETDLTNMLEKVTGADRCTTCGRI